MINDSHDEPNDLNSISKNQVFEYLLLIFFRILWKFDLSSKIK